MLILLPLAKYGEHQTINDIKIPDFSISTATLLALVLFSDNGWMYNKSVKK